MLFIVLCVMVWDSQCIDTSKRLCISGHRNPDALEVPLYARACVCACACAFPTSGRKLGGTGLK